MSRRYDKRVVRRGHRLMHLVMGPSGVRAHCECRKTFRASGDGDRAVVQQRWWEHARVPEPQQ